MSDSYLYSLISLSVAIPIDELPLREDDTYQPPLVRSPEVILGYPLSPTVEIWTVGCLVRQLNLFANSL